MDVMLKDRALPPEGRAKVEFAAGRMPVLRAVTAELEATRPLQGLRVAACLHVTTETANLCRALVAGGAELALCASNPLSTKDDVAAAIHEDLGVRVYAVHGDDLDAFHQRIERALAIGPQLVLDDGADLTTTMHTRHPELLDAVLGGTEVASAGVQRLRNMAREGALRWPMLSLNDALTKHLFDNRYGTGQNTVDGILRATNVLLAGAVLVVAGYGWCGRGIAMRARGMGARVIVVEVDPIRALEAVMDGLQVLPMAEAAPLGDVFVTVTGNSGVIDLDHLRAMKPGAIEYTLEDGKGVVLLADGRLVGQSCAEASPAEVMDLTFATQALAVVHLAAEGRGLPPGVHRVPAAIEERVAAEKLTALGVRCDRLSDEQRSYLRSWRAGT